MNFIKEFVSIYIDQNTNMNDEKYLISFCLPAILEEHLTMLISATDLEDTYNLAMDISEISLKASKKMLFNLYYC